MSSDNMNLREKSRSLSMSSYSSPILFLSSFFIEYKISYVG